MSSKKLKDLKNTIDALPQKPSKENQINDPISVESKVVNRLSQKSATTYFDSVLNQLPITLYWMDVKGKLLFCNPNQVKAFGLDNLSDILGKDIFDIAKMLGWDKSIPLNIRKNDIEIMKTGAMKQFEEKIIINGEEKIFLSYKTPFFGVDGEISGVCGIAFDITERKRIEDSLREEVKVAKLAAELRCEFIRHLEESVKSQYQVINRLIELSRERELEAVKANSG